jgi:hypothetical protein
MKLALWTDSGQNIRAVYMDTTRMWIYTNLDWYRPVITHKLDTYLDSNLSGVVYN